MPADKEIVQRIYRPRDLPRAKICLLALLVQIGENQEQKQRDCRGNEDGVNHK